MPTRAIAMLLLLLMSVVAYPVDSYAQEDGKDEPKAAASDEKSADGDVVVKKVTSSGSGILMTALLSLVVVLQVGMMYELMRVRTRMEDKKK